MITFEEFAAEQSITVDDISELVADHPDLVTEDGTGLTDEGVAVLHAQLISKAHADEIENGYAASYSSDCDDNTVVNEAYCGDPTCGDCMLAE